MLAETVTVLTVVLAGVVGTVPLASNDAEGMGTTPQQLQICVQLLTSPKFNYQQPIDQKPHR